MLSQSKLVAFASTTNPDRTRAFYQHKLGLTFVADDGFALVFDANGTMLRIGKMKDFTPAQFTVLGWEVADILKSVKDLETQGVVFERYSFLPQDDSGVWTAPGGARIAWFKDPDGNVLSLSQHAS